MREFLFLLEAGGARSHLLKYLVPVLVVWPAACIAAVYWCAGACAAIAGGAMPWGAAGGALAFAVAAAFGRALEHWYAGTYAAGLARSLRHMLLHTPGAAALPAAEWHAYMGSGVDAALRISPARRLVAARDALLALATAALLLLDGVPAGFAAGAFACAAALHLETRRIRAEEARKAARACRAHLLEAAPHTSRASATGNAQQTGAPRSDPMPPALLLADHEQTVCRLVAARANTPLAAVLWGAAAVAALGGAFLASHTALDVVVRRALLGLFLTFPVRRLWRFVLDLQHARPYVRRLARVPAAAPDAPATAPVQRTVAISRGISLSNVAFAYTPGGLPVLQGLTFQAPLGTLTAVCAPPGPRRAALVNLLAGVILPTEGHMHIDDDRIEPIDRRAYRALVHVLDGEALLPEGLSVAEVIAGGRGAIAPTHLLEAAHAAGMAEFLPFLPQGLDTRIGNPEAILSEGQRLRLLLARALAASSPVLVLDGLFTRADECSRALMWRGLSEGRSARATVILIAAPEELPGDPDAFWRMEGNRLIVAAN